MAGVSRRGFLTTSGLVVAGVGVTGSVAAQGSTTEGRQDCDGPAVETFGTASQTAAIVGATVHNGYAYVVTRGQTPPVLAEIDLATHELTRTVRLERGDGGWAVTAVGDDVYVGTYSFPDLYRFHVPTGEVERIATLGEEGDIIWCLTTTPNGKLYAGTYPDGAVWGYDPGTGDLWDWGQAAPGEQYVRTIAADDDYVYAGTLSAGHLIRFSRVDGTKLDITPPGEYGPAAAMLARDGRVICAMGTHVVDLAPDGSDVRAIEAPGDDRGLDAITTMPDGTVYAVGRPTGTVFRRTADALEPVAAPVPDDEHRGVMPLDEQTLIGAAGSGIVWWLDLSTGEYETLDLLDAGLSGPELVQSIAYGPAGTVHAAGNSAIWTHRPAADEHVRTKVAGEPKQMRVVDGLLYAAMYPSTELLSLDPGTGKLTSYGRIQNGQSRPHDMEYLADSDLLLIGSGPSYGPVQGALTVLDRADHTFTVYPNVVPDQSVVGVAVEAGVAYLGGDTWAVGSDPVAPNATVVAFDLATREVLWEVTPFEGYESLQHVAVSDGVLYGLYKRPTGTWFAMDLATQEVLRSGQLSSYGELTVRDGQVFASVFGGAVYRIGPDLEQAVLMIDGLGDGWYNPPKLAFEPTGWFAWSLSERELARLRLDPACPT